jgi:hypothetical protein
MADTLHSVGYLVCSWSAACTHACTQYTSTNTYAHACKREHTRAAHMSPCPWVVVADVSLMHSENSIADAGLTELSTALKVNQAITDLNLSCKLWGDRALRVCVCARARRGGTTGEEMCFGESALGHSRRDWKG